jgi:hypothetical protein
VFKEIYIPRTLQEVEEVRNSDEIFKNLTGVSRKVKKENESFDDSSEESAKDNESEDDKEKIKKVHGDVIFVGLSKQERKAKVKEDKTEKRKTKVPKHIKKQKTKKNKHG